MGINPFHIEKDYWVCWTLVQLFTDKEIAPHLVFRGGTSLSKGWGYIQRFSEDIDLSINKDWSVGGMKPFKIEPTASKSARDSLFKKLRQQCRGNSNRITSYRAICYERISSYRTFG